jgi:hypothetical protein
MQNSMLQQGDSGDDVETSQQALTGHGFSPGAIDVCMSREPSQR